MSAECPRCSPVGMDSLTALVLVTHHGARVTFSPTAVKIEVPDKGILHGEITVGWETVVSAPSFVDAVGQAAAKFGWRA